MNVDVAALVFNKLVESDLGYVLRIELVVSQTCDFWDVKRVRILSIQVVLGCII